MTAAWAYDLEICAGDARGDAFLDVHVVTLIAPNRPHIFLGRMQSGRVKYVPLADFCGQLPDMGAESIFR
ncbi:MAG TPA: hypothetical protein VEI74_02980 [Candidatus Methylomirabilis sp.]|nr:hypothetical protein [Candidatus Methylomirabilis sp.]